MPKNPITEIVEDVNQIDKKKLAIKLTAMAVTSAVGMVAAHFVIRQIEKKD